jgi:hypothetical protein
LVKLNGLISAEVQMIFKNAYRAVVATSVSLAVLSAYVSVAESKGKAAGGGAATPAAGGRGGAVTPPAPGAPPVAAAAKGGGGGGAAAGGTAGPTKRVNGVLTPADLASLALVPAAPPISFGGNAVPIVANSTWGFDLTGFIQDATVNTGALPLGCLSPGGTVRINGMTVTVPCNTILQFPANTLSWAEMFTTTPAAALQLGTVTPAATLSQTQFNYPSTEISIAGNVVGGVPIAGLITVSQQSLNTGSGYIVAIDYAGGALTLSSTLGGPATVRLEINDPKITTRGDVARGRGRYTAGQSPDPRYSVDQANPTIKAFSGYPMCIPAVDPVGTTPLTEDKRCPMRNRPLGTSAACRGLVAAGITVVGPDIMPFATQLTYQPGKIYCTGFVMKYTPGTPVGALPAGVITPLVSGQIATDLEPDSREMVPFVVGDQITFSGTLLKGSGAGPNGGPNGTDTISVHTIEASVAVYTAPGSIPSYVAIDGVLVGSDVSAGGTGVTGLSQEAGSRFVAEAVTTDVTSILDLYLIDLEPDGSRGKAPGQPTNRWVTPGLMTSGAGVIGSSGLLIDGGITTQATGPQAGRARLRANLVIPATPADVALNSLLASPTRYFRAVVRSMCDPANINGTAAFVRPPWQDVGFPGAQAACLDRAPAANGLASGQYLAPTGEFIFPENTAAGGPRVPYDFWKMGFLVNGEGGSGAAGDTLGPGPMVPPPW